ncbi:MAG: hypothetical protein MRY63_04245 [Neomegalonema sp.]|nr:hypothetical protein [Neomegalonema sp.]
MQPLRFLMFWILIVLPFLAGGALSWAQEQPSRMESFVREAPIQEAATGQGSDITQSCGPVTVAQFQWPSAQLVSEVLAELLAGGYACEVTRSPASPQAVASVFLDQPELALIAPGMSFGRGYLAASRPAALPDVNAAAQQEIDPPGGEPVTDEPVMGAQLYTGARGGFYIPLYLFARAPSLKSLKDIAKRPRLLSQGGRPTLYLCPQSWNCGETTRALAHVLALDLDYTLTAPRSGDDLLRSLKTAFDRNAPWVGYLWYPSQTLVDFPMRRLEVPDLQPCQSPVCQNPFPDDESAILFARSLADRAPRVAQFLGKASFPADRVQEALEWRRSNGATIKAAAQHFLEATPWILGVWLDGEALSRFEDHRALATGALPVETSPR